MLGNSALMAFAATSDLARGEAFYRDVLGLAHVETTPFAAVFAAGGTVLRVTRADEVHPAPYTVLGWIVDDMVATIAGLRERGVEFRRYDGMGQDADDVWTTPNGDRIAWFADPDTATSCPSPSSPSARPPAGSRRPGRARRPARPTGAAGSGRASRAATSSPCRTRA
jgi:catechol 2,3-dioxygenase-like lactoylglutathione lyase family enzyme